MAFTAWEFIRGALLTYVAFLPLTIIPFVFMFADGLFQSDSIANWANPEALGGTIWLWGYMVLTAGVWGLTALVPAAAGALGLGLALRREGRRAVHAFAHAGWGLVVGLVVSSLVLGAWTLEETGGDVLAMLPTVIGFGLATGIAAGLGWWVTAGLALRRDARVTNSAQTPV